MVELNMVEITSEGLSYSANNMIMNNSTSKVQPMKTNKRTSENNNMNLPVSQQVTSVLVGNINTNVNLLNFPTKHTFLGFDLVAPFLHHM